MAGAGKNEVKKGKKGKGKEGSNARHKLSSVRNAQGASNRCKT